MRIISRPFLHTILREPAAVTWQTQPWARRRLGSTQKIPRFQWQAGQHDCHTRKRTAATFTLPVLDALPDVAMVRIGFGSHSQTLARTFRRHKAGKPVHVTMPAGSLRPVSRQRPDRPYCTSRNRP